MIGMYSSNGTLAKVLPGTEWRWVETFDTAGYTSPRSKAITYTPPFVTDLSGGGASQCMFLWYTGQIFDNQ
jgi:hypothetical protein